MSILQARQSAPAPKVHEFASFGAVLRTRLCSLGYLGAVVVSASQGFSTSWLRFFFGRLCLHIRAEPCLALFHVGPERFADIGATSKDCMTFRPNRILAPSFVRSVREQSVGFERVSQSPGAPASNASVGTVLPPLAVHTA